MKSRFKFLHKEKKGVEEIEMTSLLDIIVILLFFLIKSYNSSDLELEPLGGIKMTDSISKELGHAAVTIQVNKERKIWVDDSYIGNLDRKEAVSQILAQKLDEKRAKFNERNINPTKVNLVFDKGLPYEAISKVMNTSANKGYPEFKLIVKGDY